MERKRQDVLSLVTAWTPAIRNVIPLCLGTMIVVQQTFFATEVNWELLTFAGIALGIPFFLKVDKVLREEEDE